MKAITFDLHSHIIQQQQAVVRGPSACPSCTCMSMKKPTISGPSRSVHHCSCKQLCPCPIGLPMSLFVQMPMRLLSSEHTSCCIGSQPITQGSGAEGTQRLHLASCMSWAHTAQPTAPAQGAVAAPLRQPRKAVPLPNCQGLVLHGWQAGVLRLRRTRRRGRTPLHDGLIIIKRGAIHGNTQCS